MRDAEYGVLVAIAHAKSRRVSDSSHLKQDERCSPGVCCLDYYSYMVMRDRIYGNASCRSLPKARGCLSQSTSDGVGNQKDCTVAAAFVGQVNEEVVMEILAFLLGLGCLVLIPWANWRGSNLILTTAFSKTLLHPRSIPIKWH